MEKALKMGERYTWEEVVEAYPGKWVRMSKCHFGYGNSIIDGILVGVHSDNECGDIKVEIMDDGSGDKLRRTTSDMSIGVITCFNARMEVDTDEC